MGVSGTGLGSQVSGLRTGEPLMADSW